MSELRTVCACERVVARAPCDLSPRRHARREASAFGRVARVARTRTARRDGEERNERFSRITRARGTRTTRANDG